jgi:Fe-S-cluster-containing dehydrogenase component
MACSYHHTKSFGKENSSIRVSRYEREGEMEIAIFMEEDGEHRRCDGCKQEKEPLCASYCVVGALASSKIKE